MFQVKHINNFWRHFQTEISFVRKKLTKNHKKTIFWGFIPFDCLISSKIICFNAINIGRSFVKKKETQKNTLKNCNFGQSKNMMLGIFKKSRTSCFFWSKIFMLVGVFGFWRRHKLVTRTVSQLWCTNTSTNKTNILKIINFIISLFKKKIDTFEDIFRCIFFSLSKIY